MAVGILIIEAGWKPAVALRSNRISPVWASSMRMCQSTPGMSSASRSGKKMAAFSVGVGAVVWAIGVGEGGIGWDVEVAVGVGLWVGSAAGEAARQAEINRANPRQMTANLFQRGSMGRFGLNKSAGASRPRASRARAWSRRAFSARPALWRDRTLVQSPDYALHMANRA